MKPNKLSFEPFEKALITLENAISSNPKSELERDGTIQRFEYSFELAWKSIRALLSALGRTEVSHSPKPILRDAFEEGLIEDTAMWFRFLEARNASTHWYNELNAAEVFRLACEFPKEGRKLLKNLGAKKGGA